MRTAKGIETLTRLAIQFLKFISFTSRFLVAVFKDEKLHLVMLSKKYYFIQYYF